MVGSLDVTASYPSIDTNKAANICKDKVLKSDLKFEGIDFRWSLVYLALTCSNKDKVDNRLQDVMPRKINKQGNKATILTASTDEKRERWWYPVTPGKLSETQKKKVMASVIEQMEKITFSTHLYE